MTRKNTNNVIGTWKALALVAVLAMTAGVASARPHPHRRVVRVVRRHVAVRVVPPKAVVIKATVPAPVVKVVAPKPTKAQVLKAEIASLKVKLIQLSDTARDLRRRLEGPNTPATRAHLAARLATVEKQRAVVAASIAEKEAALAAA